MRSPRWRKALRDAWLHKPRTILVVLAIAIGIIGAGAVLDTWALVRRAIRQEYDASNPPSATLRTSAIDANLLQRIRAMPAIRDVEARRTVVASARVQGAWRTAELFAVDDFTAIRIGIVQAQAGQWPPTDGALVVESSSVEFAQLAVGDSLTVEVAGAEPRTLPVVGIARDVGLAPGWMEHVVYGFTTAATLARLGALSSFDELQIAVRDRTLDRQAVRRVAFEVKSVVEGTGREVTDVDVPMPLRHIHAAQMDSLLFTQGAFGVLAVLLAAILVVNLIAAMLAGQVREIAVMKAVGATSQQVAGIYLGLAFALGVVASAIAIPVAAVLGRAYAQFTAELLNFDVTGVGIPPAMILLQLGVGLLLPVAAAAIPVVRGCRISVADALRDYGIANTNAHGGFARRASGPTRPLLLSLRNAFRRRQRMLLTLLTLATGGAVYMGAVNLRASIRGSIDLLFASQRYDIALRLMRPWPADRIEAPLATAPGVEQVEAWGSSNATLRGPDGTLGNAFPILALPVPSNAFVPAMLAGRWLAPDDGNALVVNRRVLADEQGLAVGSRVTLIVGGRATQWSVVGVVESGPSPAAYTRRETLACLIGDGGVDRVVVRGANSVPQLELVARLRAILEENGIAIQSSQLMEQHRAAMEDHLLMVAGFLGVMSQLMIAVGGLGLASTMSLAVLERRREIGVLRAIGAPHRTISAMVQVEGLVIALASWLIALPLSVPMSVVLGQAFGRIMFRVPVILLPEPVGVLQWLAVVLVVSVVACAWPAFRATRIPTAAALAYE